MRVEVRGSSVEERGGRMRAMGWAVSTANHVRCRSALDGPSTLDSRPLSPRSAFTLVEVLLVLTILGVLAGVMWPMATWWMQDQGLRQSAADVRVVLDRTRVHAVQHGLMYAFYFEPGGRHYLALPAEIPLDAPPSNSSGSSAPTGASAGAAASPAANGGNAASTSPRMEYFFGELPEGIVFSQLVPLASPAGKLNPRMYETIKEARDIEAVTTWSQPLIYKPNGSTDDQTLEILTRDAKHAITLELRGLTGTLRTSDVHLEGRG